MISHGWFVLLTLQNNGYYKIPSSIVRVFVYWISRKEGGKLKWNILGIFIIMGLYVFNFFSEKSTIYYVLALSCPLPTLIPPTPN